MSTKKCIVAVVMVLVMVTIFYQINNHTKFVENYMPQPYLALECGEEQDHFPCYPRPMEQKIEMRGDYWVLYNYIRAEKQFRCHESITYTTHSDFSFVDNLVPLIKKWNGPVSITLYAPGEDFIKSLESIAYLRDCTSPLVKQLVTFHLFFHKQHIPSKIPPHNKIFTKPYKCSRLPPYVDLVPESMYKHENHLIYPVNVGRNIAREMAQTHFVLASDIELYPSANIIPAFLQMVRKRPVLLNSKRKVFPLHIFEVESTQETPNNKTHLLKMLAEGTAIPFHQKICKSCHNIPKSKEWLVAKESKELNIFTVGKRIKEFIHWEPIYIGTHAEPQYDERLSWEGKRDKMTQGYAMCVQNYDFMILNNAFLVHRPGIKIYFDDPERGVLVDGQNDLIDTIITPEMKQLFGTRPGCSS